MASDNDALVFTNGEVLRGDTVQYALLTTHIHQLENGLILFHRFFASPQTFYTILDGEEVDVVLPKDNDKFGVHGNDLYFEANGKFYKLSFSAADRAFTVSLLRDQIKNEEVHNGALCSQLRDDKTVVYRMCDDPEKEAICVDAPEDQLKEMTLWKIVEGVAVYRKVDASLQLPAVKRLSEKAIVIELPNSLDGSFFLSRLKVTKPYRHAYFTDTKSLFTLDLVTVQFLPPLSLGIYVCGLGGVHNGVITVLSGEKEGKVWLATANLPPNYVTKPDEQ